MFEIVVSANGHFVLQPRTAAEKARSITANSSLSTQKNTKKLSVLKPGNKLTNYLNQLQNKKILIESPPPANDGDQENEFGDEVFESKSIDLALMFEYSGGPGLNSGFCRKTLLHLAIELKPSVLITHWDAISAEKYVLRVPIELDSIRSFSIFFLQPGRVLSCLRFAQRHRPGDATQIRAQQGNVD